MASIWDQDLKESVCSSSSQAIKRCHSNSETESNSDDSNIHAKRSKPSNNESDSSPQADLESPVFTSETTIKKNTAEWTDLDLLHFRLKFEKCTKIEDVFFKGISHFAEKKEWAARVIKTGFRSEEDKQKEECFQHAIQHIFNIDCNHIDEIDFGEVLKSKEMIKDSHWIADYTKNSDVKNSICRELSSSLKIFIWQLLFMVGRRNKDNFQDLSVGMFQELFVYFARIFSLNIVCRPSVPIYPLTVCGRDFRAVPDAVLCHPTDSYIEKICAIIQVTGYKKGGLEHVRRNVPKTSCAQHIKGQHGGQFLCSLPFSVFGNSGMYGFSVQGTNVTLTCFKPEDGYYDNLCSGYLHQKGATIEHSREYNILRKDDRKELVQTFLGIGKLLKFLTGER